MKHIIYLAAAILLNSTLAIAQTDSLEKCLSYNFNAHHISALEFNREFSRTKGFGDRYGCRTLTTGDNVRGVSLDNGVLGYVIYQHGKSVLYRVKFSNGDIGKTLTTTTLSTGDNIRGWDETGGQASYVYFDSGIQKSIQAFADINNGELQQPRLERVLTTGDNVRGWSWNGKEASYAAFTEGQTKIFTREMDVNGNFAGAESTAIYTSGDNVRAWDFNGDTATAVYFADTNPVEAEPAGRTVRRGSNRLYERTYSVGTLPYAPRPLNVHLNSKKHVHNRFKLFEGGKFFSRMWFANGTDIEGETFGVGYIFIDKEGKTLEQHGFSAGLSAAWWGSTNTRQSTARILLKPATVRNLSKIKVRVGATDDFENTSSTTSTAPQVPQPPVEDSCKFVGSDSHTGKLANNRFVIENKSNDDARVQYAQGSQLYCSDLKGCEHVSIDAGSRVDLACVQDYRFCFRYRKQGMIGWSGWYIDDCDDPKNERSFN